MKEIILIDAGTGNLRSVQKALESLGANVQRTDDPQKVRAAKKVVLPGVGAFGDFMTGLRARGLDDAVRDAAARGVPLLGICVGMQALFEVGEEMGEYKGLGLLPGKVVKFADSLSVKIPHTGWNQVEVQNDAGLFRGIRSGAYVYFNHSYYCRAWNSSDVIATTDYGDKFTCAVQRENIFGVQFHPEKSQRVGLQLLKNFLEAE
ncbi:MAG: imidazole glycerol phosphate synthase subunit HisH [Chloroflexota bacterium]|nr:imidazole glycerol phosphate synthase subunit HisH [Chloroflexota bacterium]MBI5704814.1 imidazole glycerol phosphate synthase subunit HisH [Chloroflexota bacterium]